MTKDKRTEKLVASAYEHLHPSTSVEDAVLADLTNQRDAARMTSRMWAGVAAAALLGATLMFALAYRGTGGAGGGGDAGDGAMAHALGSGVALPQVQQAKAELPKASREIELRLTAQGELAFRFDAKSEWKSCSLGALENALAAFGNRITSARSVFQRHFELRQVRVIVAAHTKAPWQHVQWLLSSCAKQGYATIAFRVTGPDGKPFLLDASLPVDPGIRRIRGKLVDGDMIREIEGRRPNNEIVEEEIVEEEPEEEIEEMPIVEEEPEEEIEESEIEDHNETDSDEPFKAGSNSAAERRKKAIERAKLSKRRNEVKVAIQIVSTAEGYRYRFGGNDGHGDLAQVRAWTKQAQKAMAGSSGTVVGEIKAWHHIEFGAVAGLLAEFRRMGVKRVDFYGTQLPTANVMDAPKLPPVRRR